VLNSLGEPDDRARYVGALAEHFAANRDALSKESVETLERNPLRVLDSKREQDAAIIAAAPQIADFYSEAAATHFATVQHGLTALGIPFTIQPKLVRGLDYYRHTTFEYQAGTLDSAQNAVGGGGRYDGLVEALGGPSTPAIGLALGIDRTLIACDDEGVFPPPATELDVFVVDTTGGEQALLLTTELRAAGLRADRAYENRSMKSQMKAADRSRAAVAVIIGGTELAEGTAVLRPLRTGEHQQTQVGRADLIDAIKKVLNP
jgi:histidyl-tRNA synthetase